MSIYLLQNREQILTIFLPDPKTDQNASILYSNSPLKAGTAAVLAQ